MHDQDAKKVLEAILFSTSDVLTIRHIIDVLGQGDAKRVKSLIAELNGEYESSNRTFRITKLGDGYQLRTLPMYKTWVTKIEPMRPIRLTQQSMETLAIVAYRQPVTRAEVEQVRGVDSSSGLRNLLEKKLIRIVGKDKSPGRPLIYGSTREFLSLFNLASLRDLPTLEDFDLLPSALAPAELPAEGPAEIITPTSALTPVEAESPASALTPVEAESPAPALTPVEADIPAPALAQGAG